MTSRKAEPKSAKRSDADPGGDGDGRAKPASAADETAQEPDPEAKVAAYLHAHPDFFEHNADVLAALRVPHETGGAVSLIEHQVNVLRRQLQTERGRLSQLISRARDYETASNRLHALVLKLIPARDMEAMAEILTEALCRELGSDAVTLKLFPLGTQGTEDADTEQHPLTLAFRDFLDREHALCGALEEDKQRILFGETEIQIQSAALVPIRCETSSGVLAIGAADPGRFRPDMGTDLLDRLGEIVSAKLRALPPAKARARRSRASKPKTLAKPQAAAEPSAVKPKTATKSRPRSKAKTGADKAASSGPSE